MVIDENQKNFNTEDRWKQPVHRVTESDSKCALRVAGEKELADEFHVTLDTSIVEVFAILD